jgi:hypothetical protein
LGESILDYYTIKPWCFEEFTAGRGTLKNNQKKFLHSYMRCVKLTRLAMAGTYFRLQRRCGKCPENVKYAARVRHREMLFLTPTSIQRENGMPTSRP